ncbi:MAG: carbohydrate ABC transporter substrate-binding protein [Actinobacteria bacterium]|nr:MAG: carbohydrate ABC transporter substrate-binding protein [Actinomycetota bacterium]
MVALESPNQSAILLNVGGVMTQSLLTPSHAKQTISLGSNYSDPTPKKGIQGMIDAYQSKSGNTVKVNTTEHNTYQTNITRYLQGNPDDVAAWFAGYRMQFFASKGYLADISDVWSGLQGFNDALKNASTGADGKQYFVPIYQYPWGMFYRKTLFDSKGYKPPATWDDLITLAKQMQKDGLTPIGFADKDGWPAMGTFDYINMRKNGYQFHVDLMAGKESWTSDKVKNVGTSFGKKEVGLIVFGTPHVVLQAPTPADVDDSILFPFPAIDPANGVDSVEAPIDGFMVPKKAKNLTGAKDLAKYIGSADAENAYLKVDNSNVAVNSGADTSAYTSMQKQAIGLTQKAKSISQYMDRDTRPDFAQTVMISAIQSFIDKHSPSDIDALCTNIEAQKKSIFANPVS